MIVKQPFSHTATITTDDPSINILQYVGIIEGKCYTILISTDFQTSLLQGVVVLKNGLTFQQQLDTISNTNKTSISQSLDGLEHLEPRYYNYIKKTKDLSRLHKETLLGLWEELSVIPLTKTSATVPPKIPKLYHEPMLRLSNVPFRLFLNSEYYFSKAITTKTDHPSILIIQYYANIAGAFYTILIDTNSHMVSLCSGSVKLKNGIPFNQQLATLSVKHKTSQPVHFANLSLEETTQRTLNDTGMLGKLKSATLLELWEELSVATLVNYPPLKGQA